MELLKQRILSEGRALSGHVLLVDSFLNHQVDVNLMKAVGEEFARRFANAGITRIVTIEASGIAPATMTALAMNVPMVIMKKAGSSILSEGILQREVFSFTRNAPLSADPQGPVCPPGRQGPVHRRLPGQRRGGLRRHRADQAGQRPGRGRGHGHRQGLPARHAQAARGGLPRGGPRAGQPDGRRLHRVRMIVGVLRNSRCALPCPPTRKTFRFPSKSRKSNTEMQSKTPKMRFRDFRNTL